ncbi:conserved hypothetical protein [gamma proteobacterium HTCC5015]|nr:conserved hypothetical protein [gamma proteobacterium HTCC5015]
MIPVLAMASLASADDEGAFARAVSDPGDIYFGMGVTQVNIDNVDREPQNVSAYLGASLMDNRYGGLYVDSNFSRTFIQEGKLGNTEFDFNTVSVYGAYRTPTKVYLKLKAGVVHSSTKLDSNGVPNKIDSATEFSTGAGLGIEIYPGVNLEAEVVEIQDSADAVQAQIIFN